MQPFLLLLMYLFYDRPVDMQIRALLTRSQCRVFDTEVTVKALGSLFEHSLIIIATYSVCLIYALE